MKKNKFLEKGYYGFYDKLFIRTIYLYDNNEKKTHNIITIIKLSGENENKKYKHLLQCGKLKIRKNTNLNFGLLSYSKPIEWLQHFINELGCCRFLYDDKSANVNEKLLLKEKFFVSERSDKDLSNLLKTHYCSYVDEFWNIEKNSLFDLHKNLKALQYIQDKTEIQIARTPERIGNVIIQYPNGLIENFSHLETRSRNLKIKFHSNVKTDNIKCIFTSKDETNNQVEIKDMQNGSDIIFTNQHTLQEVKLIDIVKNVILFDLNNYRDTELQHISSVNILGNRTFKDGTPPLKITKTQSYQGDNSTGRINRLIRSSRRLIEINDNIENLKYKEYDVKQSLSNSQRRYAAIGDINELIKRYGNKSEEIIIWDPYLTGQDIVDTVIKHLSTNAQIRALCSSKSDQKKESVINSSDLKHLNLEVRCASGNGGYENFHDRFFLFKNYDLGKETKGWALGYSLNGLGHKHSIIYEIDIAEYVLETFYNYWKKFDSDENIIIKVVDGAIQ